MDNGIYKRGVAMARYLKSTFAGGGSERGALAFAESQDWTDTPAVTQVLKSAVASTSMANSPALLGEIGHDFSETVRPMTILGRLQGVRHVPTRVRLIQGTRGGTAYWVGEAAPKPLSYDAFNSVTMEVMKVAGMLVVSQELLRFSSPRLTLRCNWNSRPLSRKRRIWPSLIRRMLVFPM
jgi:Phage capsid family